MRAYEFIAEDTEQMPDVDTPTIKQLAKMHGVKKRDIYRELAKGINVEYEHTTDRKLAREIALDHLKEMPDYYSKLAKMDPHH